MAIDTPAVRARASGKVARRRQGGRRQGRRVRRRRPRHLRRLLRPAQVLRADLRALPRALRYPKEILVLMSDISLGSGALIVGGGMFFVVVSISFFTGTEVGLEGFNGLQQIGAEAFTGVITSLANTREITPLVAGVALAAQVGAGFTAQLGAMRISDEIDALEVMGVNSVVYLVATRVWAALITMIPLYLAALFASYLASELVVTKFFGLSTGTYTHYFRLYLPPLDIFYSFLKAMVFAVLVTFVHCYYGYNATGGPGRAWVWPRGVPSASPSSSWSSSTSSCRSSSSAASTPRPGWSDEAARPPARQPGRRSSASCSGRSRWCASPTATSPGTTRSAARSPGRRGPAPRLGRGVPRRAGRAGSPPSRSQQNQAEVTVLIEPTFKVPATATATIQPVNLFGAEQVAISTPGGNAERGPVPGSGRVLRPGREQRRAGRPLRRRHAAAEQDQHHQPVHGARRAGPGLARARGPRSPPPSAPAPSWPGCSTGRSTRRCSRSNPSPSSPRPWRRPPGDLNNLNAQINAGLPSFNAEEADYENLLNTLIPSPTDLASLLSTYHPDIATILDLRRQRVPGAAGPAGLRSGRSSTGRTTTSRRSPQGAAAEQAARRQHLRLLQHLHPLQRREQRSCATCIAPPTGGLSFLQPIQQALAGAGSAFNCSSRAGDLQRAAGHGRRRRLPRRRRSRPPPPRRAPTRRPRPPTRPTASSGSPTRPSRPASVASSASFSGGRREVPARTSRRRPSSSRVFAAGLPRPAGGAGRQDRQHLALQQPSHRRRAAQRCHGPGQRRHRQHRGRPGGTGLEHRRAARARRHRHERQQHGDAAPLHRRRDALAQRHRAEGDRALPGQARAHPPAGRDHPAQPRRHRRQHRHLLELAGPAARPPSTRTRPMRSSRTCPARSRATPPRSTS